MIARIDVSTTAALLAYPDTKTAWKNPKALDAMPVTPLMPVMPIGFVNPGTHATRSLPRFKSA